MMFKSSLLIIIQVLLVATLAINVDLLGHRRQQIEFLSNEICTKKPQITVLPLSKSGIRSIEHGALHLCAELENIWLESNKLRRLTEGTFLHKSKLTEINLRGNELEYIDDNVFDGLIALRELNLRCNNLVRFSQVIVKGLSALKNLMIDSNRLTDLDVDGIVSKAPKLRFISLNANHLSCTRLRKIVVTMKNHNIITGDLHCPERRSLDMVTEIMSAPFYCIPDDKWKSNANQTTKIELQMKVSLIV